MVDANQARFNERLQFIDHKHRKLAHGYVQMVERDGMLIPVPNRRMRRSLPARGLVLTVAVFLLFKGFLLAELGPATYNDRVSKLADGNVTEQAGAWAMHADPITSWVASQLAPFL